LTLHLLCPTQQINFRPPVVVFVLKAPSILIFGLFAGWFLS